MDEMRSLGDSVGDKCNSNSFAICVNNHLNLGEFLKKQNKIIRTIGAVPGNSIYHLAPVN